MIWHSKTFYIIFMKLTDINYFIIKSNVYYNKILYPKLIVFTFIVFTIYSILNNVI